MILSDLRGTLEGQFALDATIMIKDESGTFVARDYADTDYIPAHFDSLTLDTPLSVSSGGTGAVSLTAHALLVGNGVSTPAALAPSTSRNVAISDGTDWTSRALVAADLTASTDLAAILAPGTTARNLIAAPTATIVPLTIKTTDDSTTNPVFRVVASNGTTVLNSISALGNILIANPSVANRDTGPFPFTLRDTTASVSRVIMVHDVSTTRFRMVGPNGTTIFTQEVNNTAYSFSGNGNLSFVSSSGQIQLTANNNNYDALVGSNFFRVRGASGVQLLNVDSTGLTTLGTAGASTARLNVNAAASGIGLIVRANATTPGNFQEWQNSSGTQLALMSDKGYLSLLPASTGGGDVIFGVAVGSSALFRVTGAPTSPEANVRMFSQDATRIVAAVIGSTSHTADLQQWQNRSGTVRFAVGGDTVASASGAVLRSLYAAAQTITITGSTNITTATGFNFVEFARPTLTSANALVVTNSATLYIANSPTVGGSTTLTNPYALWVDDGLVRLDGNVEIRSLTSGRIPYANTNGLLVDSVNLTFDGTTVTIATLAKPTTYNSVTTEGFALSTIIDSVSLTGQSADIGTTNCSSANVAGLYRVSAYLQDTTADIAAGAVSLTFTWTDDAGSTTQTITQTLATTGRTSIVFFVRLASGNLTYATTHTGVILTSAYAVHFIVERLT